MALRHKGLFPSLPWFVQAELSQMKIQLLFGYTGNTWTQAVGCKEFISWIKKVNALSKLILPVQLPAKASCELMSLGELHFSLCCVPQNTTSLGS